MGLSAASVAAALPFFTFGGTAFAQDSADDDVQLIARLVRGRVGDEGREFRLFLKSSAAVTLSQSLRVQESYLAYRDGSRGELRVAVASTHRRSDRERMRRALPPLPPVALSPRRDHHIATLSLRARFPRDQRAVAHIEMILDRKRFVLPAVRLMA